MNFEKCFDILNDRQSEHDHTTGTDKISHTSTACPCLTALTTEHSSNNNHKTVTKDETATELLTSYEDLDSLDLLEKFFRLQEERVMVCE